MKARVRPPIVPKILFYAIEPGSEQEQALAQLCRRQGILWEEVPDSRLGDPLGLLAGLAGFSTAAEPWEKETPSRQAMVFCGMEENTESAGKNECSSAAGGIESGDDSA